LENGGINQQFARESSSLGLPNIASSVFRELPVDFQNAFHSLLVFARKRMNWSLA
jgi:hypothetical protein